MANTTFNMLDIIGTAFTKIIAWVGEFLTALTTSTGSLYALLPLLALGIAVTITLFVVKIIRSFTYGA